MPRDGRPGKAKERVAKRARRVAGAAASFPKLFHEAGALDFAMSAQELLSYAERHTRQHEIKSLKELYAALADVYRGVVAWANLDDSDKEQSLAAILRRCSEAGIARTNKADPVKVFLRAMLRYPQEDNGPSRKRVSRDSKVLWYALERQVPPDTFADRVEREGGLESWARAKKRATKAARDSACPGASVKGPPGLTEVIDWRIIEREDRSSCGQYAIVGHYDPETRVFNVTRSQYIQAAELSPLQMQAVRTAIKRVTLMSRSGRELEALDGYENILRPEEADSAKR